MPRLYRQAPLNSIWEGSGNIQCLDVLRALAREPECGEALLEELREASGIDGDFDAELDALHSTMAQGAVDQAQARGFVERLALLAQAAILLRAGNPLAGAYSRSRLGGGRGATYGTLAAGVDGDAAIARILPD
jgi:putative acyl-CoA dehydrogenase